MLLNQFYHGNSDDALVKALQPTTPVSVFTKAVCASVLFTNDMHHVHFHAAGEDFDKIHEMCLGYYEQGQDESDYLAEMAMEMKEFVPNFSKVSDFISWKQEDKEAYDYAQALDAAALGITSYINFLSDLRDSNQTTDDMKSKLDDIVRVWKKEVDYKLKHRMEE